MESTRDILQRLIDREWSVENLVLGCGGGLLQRHNRDTLKFAFKCSYAVVDGEGIEVYKDPIGDSVKRSKKGKLALVRDDGDSFETIQHAHQLNGDIAERDMLGTIFENGRLTVDQTLDEIRKRAKI